MTQIQYKPEQQAVIDCRNKNQLVSASAGSGKTTIMIQKIIDLITIDKINIKDILVLTYTKASAEEMKQKLVSAIYTEVQKDPSLLIQIDDVATSDISTLHSFFQKVITKYFMVLGLNPGFEIIDETKSIKLQSQALDKAIQDFPKSKVENLLSVYAPSRNTDKIKEMVKELNRFLLALPNPKYWQENVMTKLYNGLTSNEGIKILNDELFFASQHFVSILKKLQVKSQVCDEGSYVKLINLYLANLELVKPDPDYFFENCNQWLNLPKNARITQKDDVIDLYNDIAYTKTAITNFASKIKKWSFADKATAHDQLESCKEIALNLSELTLLFQANYAMLKQKANVLDYDDLEKYMLKLIENPQICDEIRASYAKIFVDEYQDANRVQEKIVKTIAKDNNRFMVGDVKQSIYGFRQAEPDIFLETLENFQTDAKSQVGFLNYNFRSHDLILNFVNIIFEKIMTPATSKINYKDTSMFKWDNVYKPVQSSSFANVEIDIIQKPEPAPKPQPNKIYSVLDDIKTESTINDAELEAFFVAKKIADIKGKKIYVPKLGAEREIDYKDITILLRSRGSYLDKFCSVITALGIPLYANTSTSLFDDGDVELILNLLKLTQNKNLDIELVSVMHSCFGGFKFDELAQIRLLSSQKSFYECVKHFNQEPLKTKIGQFFKNIDEFSFLCKNFGHYFAYNTFLSQNGFFDVVMLKQDGIQKSAKIKKYIDDFLVNGYNFDTTGFLEFVENNKADIKAPNYSGGENCVSITTMHSSKGLEYPVVIIANANQNFDKMPQNHDIKLSQTLGMGLKFFDLTSRRVTPSLPFVAIQRANKNADFAEKLRLLYVAMTRPQNHLIIVGTVSKLEFQTFKSDFDVLNQSSYLSLIINALPQNLVEQINFGQNVKLHEFSVNIIDGNYEQDFLKSDIPMTEKIDAQVVQELKDYLYFYPSQSQLNKYFSVTALREQFEDANLFNTGFEQNTEKGVAYHEVLEKIDFNKVNAVQDVEMFLDESNIENKNLLDSNKIFIAIQKIKELGCTAYAKELPFVMTMPLSEVDISLPNDEAEILGIIDLLCLGKQNILVDYKYTTNQSREEVVKKYALQLNLYQKACQKTGKIKIDKKYILLINDGELVEVK